MQLFANNITKHTKKENEKKKNWPLKLEDKTKKKT